ncbi:MAG TPA: hypothetical protein VIJ92_13640 [Ginsengibacter sp.]
MKLNIGITLITLTNLLAVDLAIAQMPNYMPAVQQNFMNMQFNNFMMRPMNFSYRNAKVEKHNFIVVLSNDSTITIFGKINSDSSLQYLRWEDKSVGKKDTARFKRIYPYQTKSIIRNDRNSVQFSGIATDTCWLFTAVAGAINCYSPVADEDLTKGYIRYIQKNNGPLLEMSADNLREMLQDNDKALNFFIRKKYDKAISKYNKENN